MRCLIPAVLICWMTCPGVNAGILYGVAPFDTTVDSNLYRVNEATGAATLVGSTGFTQFGGIAFNAAGILYGYTPGALYTLNTSTGAATRIGFLGMTAPEGDLAFQPGTGTLFATSSVVGNDQLLTINPSTGAATVVGSLGAAGRDSSGLAFSAAGTLYGVALTGAADNLITIDTTTGAATTVGALGTHVGLPSIAALAFDPNSGILYYSDNTNLYTVNTASGAATLVGAHGVSALSGLSATVPEPAAVSMMGVALLGLQRRRRVTSGK